MAIGISVAILVIAVAAFILSPEACHATGKTTSDQTCAAKTTKESCGGDCKWERKLFSALTSSGGGKKKPDDPNLNKPTPPLPQPTPPSSGQNCLCGAGKNDYSGKECGTRGAAGGDDLCTSIFKADKICGNVGKPDGCVMTSRKPHTSNDAPDIRSCTEQLQSIYAQCMQNRDSSSDKCKRAMRACGGSGPDPGPGGGKVPGCYGRDPTGELEYLGKSCSDAPECGQTFTDCKQVEGFCRRRRRWRR